MNKYSSKNHDPESHEEGLMEEMDGAQNNQKVIVDEEDIEKTEEQGASMGKNKKHKKDADIITDLEQEKADLNDKFLRLYSEFDNYRKRTAKERLELTKTASESVIKDLLPVLDDFDRALENIPVDGDDFSKELRCGVELIYSKLKSVLSVKGLKQIEVSVGSDFDTDFQEAVTTIPVLGDELKGKVVDVIEKGYMLNDNIIRYSKVIVGA